MKEQYNLFWTAAGKRLQARPVYNFRQSFASLDARVADGPHFHVIAYRGHLSTIQMVIVVMRSRERVPDRDVRRFE